MSKLQSTYFQTMRQTCIHEGDPVARTGPCLASAGDSSVTASDMSIYTNDGRHRSILSPKYWNNTAAYVPLTVGITLNEEPVPGRDNHSMTGVRPPNLAIEKLSIGRVRQ